MNPQRTNSVRKSSLAIFAVHQWFKTARKSKFCDFQVVPGSPVVTERTWECSEMAGFRRICEIKNG